MLFFYNINKQFVKEFCFFTKITFYFSFFQTKINIKFIKGTKIGKYHDKAMKIRGYTIEDFNKDKEYFIKILKETKLNPETGQEASIISMET